MSTTVVYRSKDKDVPDIPINVIIEKLMDKISKESDEGILDAPTIEVSKKLIEHLLEEEMVPLLSALAILGQQNLSEVAFLIYLGMRLEAIKVKNEIAPVLSYIEEENLESKE